MPNKEAKDGLGGYVIELSEEAKQLLERARIKSVEARLNKMPAFTESIERLAGHGKNSVGRLAKLLQQEDQNQKMHNHN